METKVIEFVPSGTVLDEVRQQSREDFIETHASGTLRKNKRIGLKHSAQYWDERIAYEFGWEFRMLPASRVTVGVAQTEGDVKGLTEYGWFLERYMQRNVFKEDSLVPAYIQIEEQDGTKLEGNGVYLSSTSFNIPAGQIIFAIITPFNLTTGEWEESLNPF